MSGEWTGFDDRARYGEEPEPEPKWSRADLEDDQEAEAPDTYLCDSCGERSAWHRTTTTAHGESLLCCRCIGGGHDPATCEQAPPWTDPNWIDKPTEERERDLTEFFNRAPTRRDP